jgi:hypothetical protein
MEKVNLVKKIRGVSTYTNAIDNQFTELISPQVVEQTPIVTVEDFFNYYEQLFFDIPTEGEINSHKYLVEKSTQYLGGSIFDAEKAALVEEINSLRQQLIDLSSTYLTVNNIAT